MTRNTINFANARFATGEARERGAVVGSKRERKKEKSIKYRKNNDIF
jgi:hypothetical protein